MPRTKTFSWEVWASLTLAAVVSGILLRMHWTDSLTVAGLAALIVILFPGAFLAGLEHGRRQERAIWTPVLRANREDDKDA